MTKFSPPYGEIELISRNIRRITANNPAPYTYKGTGTYIIGHNEVAIIDPGPNMPDHIDAILKELNGEKITHILITHNHQDHSPAAEPLSQLTGALIYAYDNQGQQYMSDDINEGIDKDFKAHVMIKDGQIIKGKDWTIEAVHTPGHLSNHLCFAYKQERALFTGDHVMGWSTTIISPPDGNMQDYLDSLQKLIARNEQTYYPTHGKPINDPKHLLEKLFLHRLNREKDILTSIDKGANNLKDIVRMIYKNIPPYLYLAAERTIYAHLIRLMAINAIICEEPATETSKYYLNK